VLRAVHASSSLAQHEQNIVYSAGQVCCFYNEKEKKRKKLKKYIPLLTRSALFEGIDGPELEKLLDCIPARQKKIEKSGFVFMAGAEPEWMGIPLSGALLIVQDDFWGNRSIIARIEAGEIFGEAFVLGEIKKVPLSVMAAEKSEVLLLDGRRLVTVCSSLCPRHARLIKNMIRILALKNSMLVKKMEHLTRRGTRGKLLSYLSAEARLAKSGVFTIPFNRQELADYLSVDRSAMSAELCRMRDQGLIRFRKNHFELLKKQ
jgi:CRP-like cAMP-binding protein